MQNARISFIMFISFVIAFVLCVAGGANGLMDQAVKYAVVFESAVLLIMGFITIEIN